MVGGGEGTGSVVGEAHHRARVEVEEDLETSQGPRVEVVEVLALPAQGPHPPLAGRLRPSHGERQAADVARVFDAPCREGRAHPLVRGDDRGERGDLLLEEAGVAARELPPLHDAALGQVDDAFEGFASPPLDDACGARNRLAHRPREDLLLGRLAEMDERVAARLVAVVPGFDEGDRGLDLLGGESVQGMTGRCGRRRSVTQRHDSEHRQVGNGDRGSTGHVLLLGCFYGISRCTAVLAILGSLS